jgi:hypothetical protein
MEGTYGGRGFGWKRRWVPRPGDSAKLLSWEDYAKAELGLWTVLEVLAVRGNTATVRHDPAYGSTNGTTQPVEVPVARLRSVLHDPCD